MHDNNLAGFLFNTGAYSADALPFQHLVTIDSPSEGPVLGSCLGKQGIYFLSDKGNAYGIYTLPTPGGSTIPAYRDAPKQTYRWKSKKFVMPGRTTFAAAKVVMDRGCVRLKLYIDGCCRYDAVVQNCAPFRLPDQLVGTECEIELIGTAVIYEVHVGSTIEELTRARDTG